MMELSSVQAVVQRIADIEYKVGIKRPGGGVPGFHQMLRNEMKSQQAKGHGAVQSEGERAKALRTAAAHAKDGLPAGGITQDAEPCASACKRESARCGRALAGDVLVGRQRLC